MIEKYKTLNMFNKSMVFTTIYSLIALIIGLVLLLIDTSWLYGILISVGLVLLTTLINYGIYKIPAKGTLNAVGLPTLTLILRIIIFMAMFLITIFVINPGLHPETTGIFNQKFLFEDINAVIMIFVYLIPVYAFFTVAIINTFKKKEK